MAFLLCGKGKNLESLQKCGPKMDCELLPDFPNLCSNSVGQRDCNAGRSQKNGEEDRNRGRALLSIQKTSSECQGIEKDGQKVTMLEFLAHILPCNSPRIRNPARTQDTD